ncbi:response regulator transcription factor [Tepidiforma sp.]|nr:response regulator transcription factor [Tepidiforma sp.]MCX7617494.1 response regulator transcription factor [Tepidiforma sp.]GIW17696.1 MAG: DNA-binding response regulator [Tepidiforma sp.]
MDDTGAYRFLSCLLVAPAGLETRGFVRALHGGGLAVLEREPGETALRMAESGEFDIVCRAVDGDGVGGLVDIARLAGCGRPVVAVFGEAQPELVAEAFAAGADACLELEADPRVVVAQVRAVLRRAGAYDAGAPGNSGVLQVGDLVVDVDRCEVQRGGMVVPLTAAEFRIVEYMARNSGRVLKPHEILNAVSDDYRYLPREAQDVFKVYVRRIRRKLEPNEEAPQYLVTVRGFGYRLEGGRERVALPARQA